MRSLGLLALAAVGGCAEPCVGPPPQFDVWALASPVNSQINNVERGEPLAVVVSLLPESERRRNVIALDAPNPVDSSWSVRCWPWDESVGRDCIGDTERAAPSFQVDISGRGHGCSFVVVIWPGPVRPAVWPEGEPRYGIGGYRVQVQFPAVEMDDLLAHTRVVRAIASKSAPVMVRPPSPAMVRFNGQILPLVWEDFTLRPEDLPALQPWLIEPNPTARLLAKWLFLRSCLADPAWRKAAIASGQPGPEQVVAMKALMELTKELGESGQQGFGCNLAYRADRQALEAVALFARDPSAAKKRLLMIYRCYAQAIEVAEILPRR